MFSKIKHMGKKPYFRHFMISYIIILSIPTLTIGLFSYNNLMRVVTSEAHANVQNCLSYVLSYIDLYISSMKYISANISRDTFLRKAIVLQTAETIDEYEFYSAIGALKNYRRNNPSIDNIYIINEGSDFVLSADSKYPTSTFFNSVLCFQELNPKDFHNMVSNTVEPVFLPSQNILTGVSPVSVITYIANLPPTDSGGNSKIVITLKSDVITRLIQDIISNNHGEFTVYDEKNQVVLTALRGEPSNNKRNISFDVGPSETGWGIKGHFTSFQMLSKVNFLKIFIAFLITTVFFIGITIAIYFSNKHYNPIQKLIELLPHDTSVSYSSNEYDIIKTKMLNIMNDKEHLESQAVQNASHIKISFLQRIIYGSFSSMEAFNNMAKIVDVKFGPGPFALIIFYINEAKAFDLSSQKDCISCQYALQNVAHELYSQCAKVYSIETSLRKQAILLDLNNSDAQETIGVITAQIKSFFLEQLSIDLLFSCDIVMEDILSVSQCFIETNAKLENILLKKKNDVSKNKNYALATQIIDSVIKDYADNNLSLTSLAEKFSVSTSFVSKIFKTYTNYNFLEYLHLLRLEKVKDLLQTTDLSISKISLIAGFSDSHTLIRIFKRYEDMTPGQFREKFSNISESS